MEGYHISNISKDVPPQESRFRRIVTAIPAPDVAETFARMEHYESRSMHGQLPVVWDRAEGFQVFDRHGNCWIDFTSTIFVANAGHAMPAMREGLRDIIDQKLVHSYTFMTEGRLAYLSKLIACTPNTLEKAFLLSAGTEATECALKLMRLHGLKTGKSRGGILSFEGAMHGRTIGAAIMGGSPASRAWIGFEDPNMHRLDFPYPWAMDTLSGAEKAKKDLEALAASGVDLTSDICGIMIESYQGWGAIFYPEGYVETLAAYAKENDVVLCFDEIQSGFGRTGTFFAYEHYGVEADLVCCGKGMSSGFPLSGVLGRAGLMDLPDIGSMSSTNSANPLACAAGLATLNALVEGGLVAESKRKGRLLKEGLLALQKRFPDRIAHVFSLGLVAAILLKDPKTGQADGATASRVCERAMQKGLLLVHTGRESIKIGPPLMISDEALLEGMAVLSESMEACCGGTL